MKEQRRNFLAMCGTLCLSPLLLSKKGQETPSKNSGEGRLTECYIKGRPNDMDGPMFKLTDEGNVVCNLHRYAIIPCEEYDELVALKQRMEDSL